jgi:hypothetical protein
MGKYFSYLIITTIAGFMFLLSCKKEKSCEGCRDTNKPPMAIAGTDQLITLPTDSISLDGSASNDPDGTISEWLWKKISGPASFNIAGTAKAKTVVKNLDTGVYRFELFVKDNGGLTAKDTMQVTVAGTAPTNRPPVANAGNDITITLPANTILLNGSLSTDPDSNITSYQWTKVSGPSSFSIGNPNIVQTQVFNLVQGLYQFELKVTDAGGLFGKDTMWIVVNSGTVGQSPCCAEGSSKQATLTQIGNLSVPRMPIAATVGNKVVFAGGWSGFNCSGSGYFPSSASAVVDIYDIQNNSWSPAQLSQVRGGLRSITSGNKIFFAGGENGTNTVYDNVDIYDVTTNTWTTQHLSIPRAYVATAAIGTKVFFAGGYYYTATSPPATPLGKSNRVDIYDVATGQWATATLAGTTSGLYTATNVNGKVYFAGGNSNGLITVYDDNSNSWATSSFQIIWPNIGGTNPLASFAAGDNIYWAGVVNECLDPVWGDTMSTGKVEIRNTINNTIAINCFPLVRSQHPIVRNNEVAFFESYFGPYLTGWGITHFFPVYNVATGEWSTVNANFSFFTMYHDAGIVSVNNKVYVGGGSDFSVPSCIGLTDKVYILNW